jgi:hypothetical protein
MGVEEVPPVGAWEAHHCVHVMAYVEEPPSPLQAGVVDDLVQRVVLVGVTISGGVLIDRVPVLGDRDNDISGAADTLAAA